MIPSVEDILIGLLAKTYTLEQCQHWINQHIDLATDSQALRDHFAGLAMQGAIVNANLGGMPGEDEGATQLAADLAKASYSIADAMLAARTPKEPA
jgi:hypothetical protein